MTSLFHNEEDAEWSFGQVMSVSLLAIPLVTIFEFFYPGKFMACPPQLNSTTNPRQLLLGPEKQEIGESHCRQVSVFIDQVTSFSESRDLGVISAPISRDRNHTYANDHPDYELYYTSGSLTAPAMTLILSIISVSLWCLAQTMSFGSPEAIGFLQISFYPWGVMPLVIVFCVFNGILFSFMVTNIGSKKRREGVCDNIYVRSLLVFITIFLTGLNMVMYAFSASRMSYAGWLSIGVLGFYILCSLLISAYD